MRCRNSYSKPTRLRAFALRKTGEFVPVQAQNLFAVSRLRISRLLRSNVKVDAVSQTVMHRNEMIEVSRQATNGLVSWMCQDWGIAVREVKAMEKPDQQMVAVKYEISSKSERIFVQDHLSRFTGTQDVGRASLMPCRPEPEAVAEYRKIRQFASAEFRSPRRGKKAYTALLWAALALGSVFAPQAQASFMGYYDFGNFTQASTSDGFAFTADNLTVEVIGGNDGSGLPGTTTAVINAPAAGTVRFDYVYNSLDSPTLDAAGYILNGTYSQFANTDGQLGTISFAVNSGDSFGFEVWTADNLGEPGILMVNNFSAPPGAGNAVPEPRTLPTVLLAAAMVAAYLRIKRGNAKNEGKA